MLKFLKMDFYRLIKQKSTLILLLISIGIVLMSVGAIRLEAEMLNSSDTPAELSSILVSSMENTDDDKNDEGVFSGVESIGMSVNANLLWMNEDNEISVFELAETSVKSGMLAILVIVFAVIFGYAERKNGYIKNLVGQKKYKAKLLLSKFTVTAVFTAVLFVVVYISTFALAPLLLKNPLNYSVTGGAVISILAQYLIHMALGAFTVLLIVIFENSTVPIVIGTLICMGVFRLLYDLVSKLVKLLFDGSNFSLADYLPSGQLPQLTIGAAGEVIARGIAVAVIFIVGYLVAAGVIAEKKDVN